MFKKLFTAAWMALLLACCQLAAAAATVNVTATPSNPTAPATVTLAVNATSDGNPVMATQVEYFNGTTSLGVSVQSPFTLVLDNLAAGTYQISAKVTTTDPLNPILQSAPLAVTVGTTPGAATAYFIHTDQLNTPRTITNAGGAVVWQWDSDPFGKDAANEQPSGQPAFTFNQRFPGQQFDRESNLHYNYFRDYDPQTGRYTQSDPIGIGGGFNTFAYVSGNPLNSYDPYGLFGMDDIWGGVYRATNGWSPSQKTVDTVTGFGDGIGAFGYSPSRAIRKGWGINGGVNKCSPEYRAAKTAGDWYTTMIPIAGRLGYISRVSAIPRSVSTVEAAYAARVAVKNEYRTIFRNIINAIDRDASLADVLAKAAARGDAYAIARAGVTNRNWNALIFGSAAANVGSKIVGQDDDCTCTE